MAPSAGTRSAVASATPTLEEAAILAERNGAIDVEKRRRADERRVAAKKAADAKKVAAAVREEKKLAGRKGKDATDADLADMKPARTRSGKGKMPADPDDDLPKARKALADRTSAAPKKGGKPDDDDAAVPSAKSQVWVQVAGGATERDLAKAWSAARAKAPALNGRTGYTTPLRATNRVVTGPFKSEEEAQALVNTLSRQGVSAFTFTSGKGQRLTRVGARTAGQDDDTRVKNPPAAKRNARSKDTDPSAAKGRRRK